MGNLRIYKTEGPFWSVLGPITSGTQTIIGSQCQLVHSDWLPSVLQTEDQQRTDDFVYIISAVITFLLTAKDFSIAEMSFRITVCMLPPPCARADVLVSFSLKVHFHGLNLWGYFHLVPRTFRLTNLCRASTRQYSTKRPYFVTIRWFLGMSQKSIEPFP